jgi:hypothetical protein
MDQSLFWIDCFVSDETAAENAEEIRRRNAKYFSAIFCDESRVLCGWYLLAKAKDAQKPKTVTHVARC